MCESAKTRRQVLRLLGPSTAGLVAACAPLTPSSVPGPTLASAPATASSVRTNQAPTANPAPAQPRAGGTLRVGLTADPANLDPHLVGGTSVATSWLAFDTLTRYDRQLKPQPMLAEQFEVSPDYRQVKLGLRRGVSFHSG